MSSVTWPPGVISPRLGGEVVQGAEDPTPLFSLAEVFEEAYSRCGMELREGWHIVDGTRSLRLLFQEWSNRGVNLWTVVHEKAPIPGGAPEVDMPPGTVDVMNAFIRMNPEMVDQQDYYLKRMSTDEWDRMPQKRQRQRPYRYWMNRAPRYPVMVVWPQPDMDYTLYYSRLRALRKPGPGLTGEIDAPDRMIPALVSGLAWMVASKNKEAFSLLPGLRAEYDRQWLIAGMEDREKSDLQMTPMEYWP